MAGLLKSPAEMPRKLSLICWNGKRFSLEGVISYPFLMVDFDAECPLGGSENRTIGESLFLIQAVALRHTLMSRQ